MQRRHSRLRQSQEITAILRRGRRLTTPWVRIYWRPGQQNNSRLACIVGTRVSRSAVARHRYQRWLREIAQAAAARHFPIPSDMVWVATPQIVHCQTLAQLREHVTMYKAL